MLTVPSTGRPSTTRVAAANELRICSATAKRALAGGVVQERRELFAAQAAEQVDAAQAAARHFGKDLQHAVADGVAVAVVDRFEIIEIEQHHRGRARIVDLALEVLLAFLQERAAIGDAGQGIDHRRGLLAMLGALLRHRQKNEGDRDGEQQPLEAERREPHAFQQRIVAR